MTPDQRSFDDLADEGAALLADPCDPRWLDLRGQGMTADDYHRIHDIQPVGEWL